jgi:hypothetical protein
MNRQGAVGPGSEDSDYLKRLRIAKARGLAGRLRQAFRSVTESPSDT